MLIVANMVEVQFIFELTNCISAVVRLRRFSSSQNNPTSPNLSKQSQKSKSVKTVPKNLNLSKQSQKSRSVLQDRSRFLGLFLQREPCPVADFYMTDLHIWVTLWRENLQSYSRINMVIVSAPDKKG